MSKLTSICVLIAFLITGCSDRDNRSFSPVAVESPMQDANTKPASADALATVIEKLNGKARKLGHDHSIDILWYGSFADSIEMNVRSYGDIEHKLTDEELEAFKQRLFELNGAPFSIKLSVSECCGDNLAPIGIVTEIDKERNRILVVSETKKNGNTNDPAAVWIGLTDDANVYIDGKPAPREFGDALIGKEARAWTTGLVEESYPEQVTGIKVMLD
ncbi:hypothetical protein [Cohnella soli]|uniref:DUF4362 domain-containing protein n=1 Tax=Cohnella soli TaxID=425005 RepID=A0ABW0HX66_9BACL